MNDQTSPFENLWSTFQKSKRMSSSRKRSTETRDFSETLLRGDLSHRWKKSQESLW